MTIKKKLQDMIAKSKSRPRMSTHDEQGRTICDPKPLKYPVGFKKPPTREQMLQNMFRAHQAQLAFDKRYEDETNFNIDEPDMLSPYERNAHVYDMEPEIPANVTGEQDTPPSPDLPANPPSE